MKKSTITATVLLVSSLFVLPVQAGTGHSHDKSGGHSNIQTKGSVSGKSAAKKATHKIGHLAGKGKIDKSWKGIKPASIEKKTFGNGPEWVVTFRNMGIQDKSKQVLYVFYTLDGHYLATNYTGK